MPGIKLKNTIALALLLPALLVHTSHAIAADPPQPATKPSADWATAASSVPLPKGRIRLGPPGSNLCLVGNLVLDTRTSQPTGISLAKFPAEVATGVFSPDAQFFAAPLKSQYEEDCPIQIWNLQTGQPSFTIPGIPKQRIEYFAFTGAGQFITSGHSFGETTVYTLWDLATGQQASTLTTTQTAGSATSITPNGRYLAKLGWDSITVYDIQTGKAVALMTAPPGSRSINDFSGFSHLAFSPDGKELAAYGSHGTRRLCVWDTSGKLVEDIPIRGVGDSGHPDPTLLKWFPDGQAWLINNSRVVDRPSQKTVVRFEYPFGWGPQTAIIDTSTILLIPDATSKSITTVKIPWDEAKKSLRAMSNPGTPAAIRPNMAISLEYQLELAHGTQNDALSIISEYFNRLPANAELSIAPNQPTTITLRLTTKRPAPPKTQTSFPSNPPAFAGYFDMELTTPARSEPVFSQSYSTQSSPFGQDTSDDAMHKSLLKNFTYKLDQMEIPYFIPLARDLASLPIIIKVNAK
jgi:hypothetical protein